MEPDVIERFDTLDTMTDEHEEKLKVLEELMTDVGNTLQCISKDESYEGKLSSIIVFLCIMCLGLLLACSYTGYRTISAKDASSHALEALETQRQIEMAKSSREIEKGINKIRTDVMQVCVNQGMVPEIQGMNIVCGPSISSGSTSKNTKGNGERH